MFTQLRPEAPRIIVMLGARMVKPEKAMDWQFPLFVRDQTNRRTSLPGEVSGGFSRMRAVQIEFTKSQKVHENALVLVTGGNEKTGQSRADEAARQLVSRYGLPAASVRSIGGGASTLGNARDSLNYILRNSNESQAHKLDIVTNDYHMLRAWLMYSFSAYQFANGKGVAIPPSAIAHVKDHLSKGISSISHVKYKNFSKIRTHLIDFLQPFLGQSVININPVVVEETLENCRQHEYNNCFIRYAQSIRSSKWVSATFPHEFNGILDLVAGSYRDGNTGITEGIQSRLA